MFKTIIKINYFMTCPRFSDVYSILYYDESNMCLLKVKQYFLTLKININFYCYKILILFNKIKYIHTFFLDIKILCIFLSLIRIF